MVYIDNARTTGGQRRTARQSHFPVPGISFAICIKCDHQPSWVLKRRLAGRKKYSQLRGEKVTQVVTVSATTAAYAAEAAKPSARPRGNGSTDEALALLSHRRKEALAAAVPAAATKGTLAVALMLMSAERRPPQESAAETLRHYLEYLPDEENGERREEARDEPHAPEDQAEGSLIEQQPGTEEGAAFLDELIQGD